MLRRSGQARIVYLALLLGCSPPPPEGAAPRLEGLLPASSASPAPAPAPAGMADAAASRLAEPATVHDVEAFLVPEPDPCRLPEVPTPPAPSSSVASPSSSVDADPPTFGRHRPRPPLVHTWHPGVGPLPPEVIKRLQRAAARHVANVRACCADPHERAAVEACLRAKEPPPDGGIAITYPMLDP